MLALFGVQSLQPPTPAVAATAKPKAVIIAGPAATSTSHFLDDARIMADQAEAAGFDVRRIFHPHATWERVLNNIQGANFVVYMGHGNGWPSPYAPFQERTKNGLGLDGYDGASKYSVTYYGANPIRANIRLAKNAVVALVHLCYSSGNAEPGMSIPSWNTARQRVDNYAAPFLDAGARTVFSFGWMQKWNLPRALMETAKSMDELFRTDARGTYPYGWIGWNDKFFDSERVPGARIHMDPHPTHGFYRAVTGDLKMTAREFRGAAPPSDDGGGDTGGTGGTGGTGDTTPPALSALSVVSTDGGATSSVSTASLAGTTLPSFRPNGDGLHEKVVISHTLSESAYLDVKITNAAGSLVRKFSVLAKSGTSTTSWAGKNGSGAIVADGAYTLSYKPRDAAGNVGTARSVKVLVLSAIALLAPQPAAFYSRDLDSLAQSTAVTVKTNKQATVTVKVVSGSGAVVRTLQPTAQLAAGSRAYVWDGRNGSGGYVGSGAYRIVATGQTAQGTYSEQRSLWLGAFRLDASTLTPARGSNVTFTVFATEPMVGPPVLDLRQPGLATYSVGTTKVAAGKFKVTVTLKSGGSAGTLTIVVRGTDSGGQEQRLNTWVTLR